MLFWGMELAFSVTLSLMLMLKVFYHSYCNVHEGSRKRDCFPRSYAYFCLLLTANLGQQTATARLETERLA